MKPTKRTLGIAGVTAATAALVGTTVLPNAQAASQSRTAAAVPAATAPANSGIPVLVNPDADLAARSAGAQPGPEIGSDSIYASSWVKGGGHDYGIIIHVLKRANIPPTLRMSVNDETTGWYRSYVVAVPADQFNWSTSKLSVSAPGLSWTGDEQHMTIKATTPWGAINLQLTNNGPTLSYSGNGVVQVFGSTNYEYALPRMTAAGTLTVRGETSQVTGGAWVDRQWGPIPFTASSTWSWMNLNLSNGDKVAVWDDLNSTMQSAWATIQRPDGSYEVAAVKPLADGASAPWTSTASGNTYPTRWSIDIPSLHTQLQVRVTGTPDQELGLTQGPGAKQGVEATGAVSGLYQGQNVTGYTYIEEAGNW
jgi:hypothetical protein